MGSFLRLWHLGTQSFWHDESWTWALAQGSLSDLFRNLIHLDNHPPLYYLLLWPLSKISVSEAMLRAPSAIFGIASLPFMFLIGRTLGGTMAGLLAMAFLAVAPFHVKHSQEARGYALLFLLCVISLNLLLSLRQQPNRRSTLFGLAMVTALIVYTEYLGVFFILGEVWVVLVLAYHNQVFGKRALFAAVGGFALFLPWVPFAIQHVTGVSGGFWLPKPTPGIVCYELGRLLAYSENPFVLTFGPLPLALLA